ncbi:hypothetical protein VPNG_07351 [Cytospora leucostoma]|uniref:Methyltransferase type 11 domain-containing protein n=1 Tax=Cytospora leucostoma TaxID=1230097 RepID=A0A423WUI3_9PEZI|nr:hypothetical protein VPNG_07351 [Cytospora leucostoma]
MAGKTDFTKLNQDHFDWMETEEAGGRRILVCVSDRGLTWACECLSNEAADYDARHEKTTEEIARRIEARRDLIGMDWVEDDSSSGSSEDEEDNDARNAPPPPPGKTVKILDYACGTGSMSRALAPYITQSIGIDLSEKMVAAYNTRARNQGLAEDEMAAYHGNLCVPGDGDPAAFRDPKFFGFDLAVVGLGFHHFDDPELAAERLVARLGPGGVLMIIDFLPHAGPRGPDASEGHSHSHGHDDDHHDHDHDHQHADHAHHHDEGGLGKELHDSDSVMDRAMKTVTHHGFSEEHIREIFVSAGAGKDFAIDNMGQVVFGPRHGKRTLFMARGTRA